MQNSNSRAKGECYHQGCVAEYFKKMRTTIERNDGTMTFEWITDTYHDQQAPFDHNKGQKLQSYQPNTMYRTFQRDSSHFMLLLRI